MMMQNVHTALFLKERVSAYLDAFNRMDLEAVMSYFAANAQYHPGDGSEHHGLKAIRRAFLPQFSYAWGEMFFKEEDLFLDASAGKVLISWICQINAQKARFYSLPTSIKLSLGVLRFGMHAGWKGVDVLHFDTDGTIERKYTYANYERLRIHRELGRAR